MAKRERPTGAPSGVHYPEAVEAVRSYYNSDDARRVYETAYGDEHLHLGIYENDDDTIDEAGQRTMERMASMVRQLGPSTRVLDIGSGHGGSARYLFHHYGCHVACLNLSDVQNARNRAFNASGKCSLAINVVDGSFEDIPVTDESFDVVWSQDAIPAQQQPAAGIRGSRPGPGQRRTVHLHRPHARRPLPRGSPATHPRPRQPRLPGIPSEIPGHAVRAGLSGA